MFTSDYILLHTKYIFFAKYAIANIITLTLASVR